MSHNSLSFISFLTEQPDILVKTCYLKAETTSISHWNGNEIRFNTRPVVKCTIEKIEKIIAELAVFGSLAILAASGLLCSAYIFAPIVLKGAVLAKSAFLITAAATSTIGLTTFVLLMITNQNLTEFKRMW